MNRNNIVNSDNSITITTENSDAESDSGVPEVQVCQKLVNEFTEITTTNAALAQFYLQRRNWELDHALNAYYEELASTSKKPSDQAQGASEQLIEKDEPQQKKFCSRNTEGRTMNPSTSTESSTASSSVPEQPKRLKLISWNIDGLDTNNIKNRTKGVQRVIANEKPDIVFFQEAIPKSFAYLEGVFDETYECIAGGDTGYFTAALVKKATVKLHDFYLEPFYSSKMGRNLLILQTEVTSSGIPLLLMTSHLESTKEHASERKNQLKKAFEEMKVADSKYTVIFGGDMNTRDSEIVEIGGLPEGISDLYEVTGSRPECKYTWDTNRNDNCIFPGKFKPRCRFDRLYMRPCKSPVRLKPVYFELVGIERLPTCQRFPSDHWGMAVNFDIV